MRHGESTWKLQSRFIRATDVDLTEQGVSEIHVPAMNAVANQGKATA